MSHYTIQHEDTAGVAYVTCGFWDTLDAARADVGRFPGHTIVSVEQSNTCED